LLLEVSQISPTDACAHNGLSSLLSLFLKNALQFKLDTIRFDLKIDVLSQN